MRGTARLAISMPQENARLRVERFPPQPRDLKSVSPPSERAQRLLSIRPRHLKNADDAVVRSLIFIQFRRFGNPECVLRPLSPYPHTHPPSHSHGLHASV